MLLTSPAVIDGTRFDPKTVDKSPPQTLYEEFKKQIETYPEESCRRFLQEPSGDRLTYFQLNNLTLSLVNRFIKHLAVGGNGTVAVLLPPSCARIAALLALNAIGLPFVPLDSVQTAAQRAYILEHGKVQAVLTNKENAKLLDGTGARLILLDAESENKFQENGMTSKDGQENQSTCLILYTSGSTGVPKGVCLTDANLLNRLRWQWAELPYATDGSDVCLAKTNILFVDSYTEILGAVLRLQNLIIVDSNSWKQEAANIAAMMAESIRANSVTRLILVPSLLSAMLELPDAGEKLSSLRLVVSSGEALPSELARRFFRIVCKFSPQLRLANFYGSTEVTGDVTAAIFASEADVVARTYNGCLSIGRAVYNTSVYICQEDQPIPVSVEEVGTIYVSGDNVCAGFAGESSRQIDRFSSKPESISLLGYGERMLSMGDLGLISPSGELFHCGRGDSLVKIRGNRVSTLQVEEALKNLVQAAFDKKPPVNEESRQQPPRSRVVSVEHQQSATFKLAAFYESWPEAAAVCLRPDNVRKVLAESLPYYAVPEIVIPIAIGSFPMQIHTGKTDQRRLKQMALDSLTVSSKKAELLLDSYAINPANLEASAREGVRLVAASVLGLEPDQVLMEATFFNQGGNSLSVIAAVVGLKKVGFLNATAEMLLMPNQSLEQVAIALWRSFEVDYNGPTPQNCSTTLLSRPVIDWIEYRDLKSIETPERLYIIQRMDYTFSVLGPLGKLLKLPSNAFSRMLSGEWNFYANTGSLSFAVVDKRRSTNAMIGAVLCCDLTDRNPDQSVWQGIEAVRAVLAAAEKPVYEELLQRFGNPLPKGAVLSFRMVYVDPNMDENDASAAFMDIEREVIKRAKDNGYKLILTKNASLATQAMERDIFGYQERFALHARNFQLEDGSQPYRSAPDDYAILTMTLDL